MSDGHLDPPSEPGVLMQVPPLRDIPGLITARGNNAQREEMLQKIVFFSRNREMHSPDERKRIVVATGHQPGFHHSGILSKQFALSALARKTDALAIYFTMDNDVVQSMTVPVPGPGFSRTEVCYRDSAPGQLFEETKAGSRTRWDRFVDDIHHDVVPELRPNIERFADAGATAWRQLGPRPPLALFLDTVRRNYIGDLGILELPVSSLCQTIGFSAFVSEILLEITLFRNIYNDSLAAFRKERKIRLPSMPARDLQEEAQAIETPFWVVTANGQRKSLWLRTDGALLADAQRVGQFDGKVDGLLGLPIRPKAISFSLYQRRYLCDLFIHGIGGASYDLVTNQIYRRFWNEAPPVYACVSISLPLPLPGPGSNPATLQKNLDAIRTMEKHPLDYLHRTPDDVRTTVEELDAARRALLERLGDTTATADKNAIFGELKKLNDILSDTLRDLKSFLESECLKEIERHRAFTARDYPYFCFDPQTLHDIVSREI